MSNFTTEVRFICETEAGELESKGFNSIDEILSKSVEKIFNFNYPIFDENYRIPLETKILKYYYTREICDETVALWKLRLCNRLNLIMPYYNQLYESELIKFNPLYDVDVTTKHTRTNDHTQNDTKSGEVHNTHADVTVTDFEKSGNENGSFQTNHSKESTDETNGTENKIFETHEIGEEKNHNTDVTDETTIYRPATTKTTHNESTSHTELAITENHQTLNDNTDETYKDYTSNKPNITVSDNGDKWDYYSDTPQGSVQNLENLTYLTNARNNTNDNTQTTTGETQIFNDGEKHITHRAENTAHDSHITDFSDEHDGTETMSGSDTTDHDNTVTTDVKIDTKKDTDGEEHSDNHSTTEYEETGNENGTNEKNYSETSQTTVHNTGNYDTTNAETGNTVFNGTEDYIQHIIGKTAGMTYSKMLLEFRDTFLNIDKMIINNLSDLFFGLYE